MVAQLKDSEDAVTNAKEETVTVKAQLHSVQVCDCYDPNDVILAI